MPDRCTVIDVGRRDRSPPAPADLLDATGTGWPWSRPTTTPHDADGAAPGRVPVHRRPTRPAGRTARAPRPATDPHVPSLAALSFPAGRFEREMRDLYGIAPDDHPLPRRLVRHPHWPRGWYPMRRDAGPPPPFGRHRAVPVPDGRGRRRLRDPRRARPRRTDRARPLPVLGRRRDHPQAQGPAVVRPQGNREALRGPAPLPTGIALAERISGDTAVGHALAYCLAVEDALGIDVDPRPQRARAVLLELERLHNHVADIGALVQRRRLRHRQRPRPAHPRTAAAAQPDDHRPPAAARRDHPGGARAAPRCPTRPGPRRSPPTSPRSSTWPSTTASCGTGSPAPRSSPASRPSTSAPSATSPAPAASPSTPASTTRSPTSATLRGRRPATAGDVLARFLVRADEIQASARAARPTCCHATSPDRADGDAPRLDPRRHARRRRRHRRGVARHDRPPGRDRRRTAP